MKITILTENLAGGTYLAEHGLSYLIEIDGECILFDTGHSDVFLQNANKLGVDIQNSVTQVVLSHGHWDHGNGLKHLSNKTLITHPQVFIPRFRKSDHSPVGLAFSEDEIKNQFQLIETTQPYELVKNVFFLGEIPRLNDFESQTTPFELASGDYDFVNDDSALVVVQNNELIVITACSHSGICNICEYAKKVTGQDKIRAVIGGFHLKFQNKQTEQTIEYFKKNKVETILPSHCTDLPALALFYQQFKIQQVKTGMTFEF
ncbi:MBL fold metallo-hydrolase [uncultured Draconibacterium sp.]|uniref:MBL fold metallo-hydrolase n=1 Tax=uncultured Draconibacterium sp. TaxID=1573823 RepID=UPI0032176679